jgi:hypothetical protein
LERKEQNAKYSIHQSYSLSGFFVPKPTQPPFSLFATGFFGLKKGKGCLLISTFYGFFRSINNASTAPITMIATNKPAIAGTKYWSATDFSATGNGVAVGAAGSTANAVSACDGQYELLPSNDA